MFVFAEESAMLNFAVQCAASVFLASTTFFHEENCLDTCKCKSWF